MKKKKAKYFLHPFSHFLTILLLDYVSVCTKTFPLFNQS